LRIRDMDFSCPCVVARDNKGEKDEVAMISGCIPAGLKDHLTGVKKLPPKSFSDRFK
jgi:hypothetical protein